MRIGIVAHQNVTTSAALAAAWRSLGLDAAVLTPDEALDVLGAGDVALLRLDVLPTVDGIEAGLDVVPALRRAGVRILNPPAALLAAHDKLWTFERLAAAGIPQPATVHVLRPGDPVNLDPPFVVKPRFGSWGLEVFLCESELELRGCLRTVEPRSWFARHGALVQELVSRTRRDVRLVVADERVVAAAGREAAPGEWRTNVSLGGSRFTVAVEDDQRELALEAMAAIGGDLMGVDLLPASDGTWVVIELNGAVDFDEHYFLPESDAYADTAAALGFLRAEAVPAALAAGSGA